MEVLHHGLSPARLTRLRYPRMVLKERSQFKNIAFIGFVTRLAALRLASLLPCQLSSLAKEMLTFSCGKVRYIYFFFWILRKACMCLCSSCVSAATGPSYFSEWKGQMYLSTIALTKKNHGFISHLRQR